MIHSEQIRYILYCIFLSELTVLSINGQRFDLAALSNLRAAANQPNLNTRNNLRNTILNDVNSVSTCLDSNIRFELITGYVFTAPDDMLDSRPGTLMLTDCIELCKRNSTCRSANFETGLCVLFGSSADDYPGGLTASQFPVFTLYIQKVCLPGAPKCDRAWSFEKVSNYGMDKYAKKRGRATSRQNCELLCLTEKDFPCRSATYSPSTNDCRISDMDRHTVAGTEAFVASSNDEYLENNCVDDPVKLCDFQLLENRIMKTVDSVYQDVPTMEACRDLCLTAPYRCHSFDYGDTGQRVCRLSHHTSVTLTQIQEPFLVIEDVVGTYELSSCYNVTIDCRASEMIATVRTNKIFNGKVYAKDNPNSCVTDVENGIEFSIKMGYNDIECNVKRKGSGFYSNEVIIQHHDSIVTSSDLGLALNCQYDLSNRTILNDFDLAIDGEIEPSLFEEAIVDSPNVIMKITERGGGDIKTAQVGDALELRFEILDMESPYEISVRDLVAKDGNDQAEIILLDSLGCPTEGQIMGPLLKSPNNPKILVANFDAFKFPTSEVVQFRAHVTPCMPTCEPIECVYKNYYGGDNTRISSYGRKKRNAHLTSQYNNPLLNPNMPRKARNANIVEGSKMLVTQAFVVSDKFNKKGKNDKSRNDLSPRRKNNVPALDKKWGLNSASHNLRPHKTVPRTNENYEFSYDYADVFERERNRLKSHGRVSSGVTSSSEVTTTEVCLNTTGIIVAVAMFIVIQILIAFVWSQIWQRKRKLIQEKENQALATHNMFNPYAVDASCRDRRA